MQGVRLVVAFLRQARGIWQDLSGFQLTRGGSACNYSLRFGGFVLVVLVEIVKGGAEFGGAECGGVCDGFG